MKKTNPKTAKAIAEIKKLPLAQLLQEQARERVAARKKRRQELYGF